MPCGNDNPRCDICCHSLEQTGHDSHMLCPTCANAVLKFLNETNLSDEYVHRIVAFAKEMVERGHAVEVAFQVPTFYGHAYPGAVRDGLVPEFGPPLVPILVQRVDGLRLVLGSCDAFDQAPDVQIERRPNGWAMFLHPASSGDPSGYVYFIDDGHSFVVPDSGVATPAIQIRQSEEVLAVVDRKKYIE